MNRLKSVEWQSLLWVLVSVLVGLVVTAPCGAQIRNIDEFLEQCPTTDPAFGTITSDFVIRVNGVPVTEFPCSGPTSSIPISQYTDALIVLQTLRTIYYMDRNMPAGHLPWTSGSLYDWMKAKIAGINIVDGVVGGYCCDTFDDGKYIVMGPADEFNRNFDRTWEGISGNITFYAHERRHADPPGYGHVSCCGCGIPYACDQTYDEADLSPYAIQWWLDWAWLTGYINVGIGCLDQSRVTTIANWHLNACNLSRDRFCDALPPVLTLPKTPGGECLEALCTCSMSPTSATAPVNGGSGTIAVTTGAGCSWSASESCDWVTISPASGTGNGAIIWTATANTGPARQCTITACSSSFTLWQAGPFDWWDDMESGQKWTTTGLWHLTTKRNHSPAHSQWFGDESTGAYGPGSAPSSALAGPERTQNAPMATGKVHGELTSPPISVTGGTGTALSFWHWREVEHFTGGSFDKTYAQVKYGGGTWQTVWSLDSKTASSKSWEQVTQSLNVPVGVSSLQVRFVFDSVDSYGNNYAGWFIDDVVVGQGSGLNKVAAPTFAPAPSTYTGPVSVTLACGTPGATIRYTTDGTGPTGSSSLYSTPIPITVTTMIKARAYKTGWTESDVASGTYTIQTATGHVELVSVDPPAGTQLLVGTSVAFHVLVSYELAGISGGLVGAELGLPTGAGVDIGYCQVTPGSGTAEVSGSVGVAQLQNCLQGHATYVGLAFLVIKIGYQQDASTRFLFQWESLPDQCYKLVGLSDSMESGQNWIASGLWHLATKKNHSPTHSQWFGDESTGTYGPGSAPSSALVGPERTENVPMATGKVYGELTSPSISVTSGTAATVSFWHWREVEYYTKGNYDKTYVQVKYGGGTWQTVWMLDSKTVSSKAWEQVTQSLNVPAGVSSLQVRFVFDSVDGYNNNYAGWFIDDVAVSQAGSGKVAAVTFAPAPSTYSGPVNVTLACGTPGATIRYTTDGTEPTGSSALYGAPITITVTTAIKARAYKTGWTESDVATGTYTISTGGFSDDMESGQKWTASGLWHLATKKNHSPTHSQWFGDESTGTYGPGSAPSSALAGPERARNAPMATGKVSGELTSPSISVTGGTAATLSFWHWREVEYYTKGSFDKTYAQVKYGGGTWQTVWSLDSKTASSRAWEQVTQSLNVPAGVSSLQVRFVFDSVDKESNNYVGWFIDDVSVVPGGPATTAQAASMRVMCIPSPITDLHTARFVVKDVEAERIRVEVYDLAGTLVWLDEEPGNEITWHAVDQEGLPLANGIYIYRALVQVDGTWVLVGWEKLAILR